MEQLELFMLVNKIKENKVTVFLTVTGCEGYRVLKSLCIPTLPKDVEYKKLVINIYNLKSRFWQNDQNFGVAFKKTTKQALDI